MKTIIGTSLFSNILTQDTLSNKFSLTILLDDEQRSDAESQELKIKVGSYQDTPQVTARFSTKFELPVKSVVGRDKLPFVSDTGSRKEIGKGSKVVVHYRDRAWSHLGKSGVSHDLVGIQVIEESAGDLAFDSFEDSVFDESNEAEY